ncbi:MAG: choice-of-anchor D domain-containing protein, partial [Nitrospirae bacterium]|nr:choice-of-anchor D domain-containing protein [Nitrospirota bacterium]
ERRNNSGDDGDLYPGSANNNSFTGSSSPASKLYNGLLNIVSVTSIGPSQTVMTATLAVHPNISVEPLLINFGDVDLDANPVARRITVANSGRTDLVIGEIRIEGRDTHDFVIRDDGCSDLALVPESSCSVDLLFSATSYGPKHAVLTIPSNDPDTPEAGVTLVASAGSIGDSWDCFIATAAYGSYLDPHVEVLRRFRDRWLIPDIRLSFGGYTFRIPNVAGRGLVRLYYRYSPPLAAYIAKHEGMRTATRLVLTPLVYGIRYPSAAAAAGALLAALLLIRRSAVRKRRPPRRLDDG